MGLTRSHVVQGTDLPEHQVGISQDQITRYSALTEDVSPIHTDENFAAASQWKGIIAQGTLVTAFLMDRLTAAFPWWQEAENVIAIVFLNPVRPGDEIAISCTVLEADGDTIKVELRAARPDGQPASIMTATIRR